MSARKEVFPEYVYITIPSEYVCVYHRILAMLSDYGEEMLKDCKASCTDKNSGVIECFNMFNAAVAARALGEEKKAGLIINYVKAKINQIYKGKDNSTEFIFPIDENGELKAFVSCNDRPRFFIDEDELLMQRQGLGFDEQFSIEDEQAGYRSPFDFLCEAEIVDTHIVPNITFNYNGFPIPESELDDIMVEYYVDGVFIDDLTTFVVEDKTTVSFKVFAYFKGAAINHTYLISNYGNEN